MISEMSVLQNAKFQNTKKIPSNYIYFPSSTFDQLLNQQQELCQQLVTIRINLKMESRWKVDEFRWNFLPLQNLAFFNTLPVSSILLCVHHSYRLRSFSVDNFK